MPCIRPSFSCFEIYILHYVEKNDHDSLAHILIFFKAQVKEVKDAKYEVASKRRFLETKFNQENQEIMEDNNKLQSRCLQLEEEIRQQIEKVDPSKVSEAKTLREVIFSSEK